LICQEFEKFRRWYLDVYLNGENKDEYVLYKKLNKKLKNYFGNINMDTLNEQNEGIAYVSQAINEIEKHGGEMIIGIE
jgi:hypothetical protein